jgi:hypothetical protein
MRKAFLVPFTAILFTGSEAGLFVSRKEDLFEATCFCRRVSPRSNRTSNGACSLPDLVLQVLVPRAMGAFYLGVCLMTLT